MGFSSDIYNQACSVRHETLALNTGPFQTSQRYIFREFRDIEIFPSCTME
jgi:hypothetical protein